MSKLSKQREQEQLEQQGQKSFFSRKAVRIGLVVVAFAIAAALGLRARTNKVDDFAKCLSTKNAKMYGAFWCPHCKEQKELFDTSFQYVTYVECGVMGDVRAQTQVCKDAGIKQYPTWVFADGSRVEGKQSFQALSEKTGCPLP